MINVLFIFSMLCCLLRESLLFSLPPSDLFFARLNVQEIEEKNQTKDFLRALSILFVFHTALVRSASTEIYEAKKKRSWYHKIRTKPSVIVFKHVMHHTYAPYRRSVFLARSLAFVSAPHIDPNLPRKAKEEAAAAKMDDFMLKS